LNKGLATTVSRNFCRRHVGLKAFRREAAAPVVSASSAASPTSPISVVRTRAITRIGVDRFLDELLFDLSI
jgi:hypothetical protein